MYIVKICFTVSEHFELKRYILVTEPRTVIFVSSENLVLHQQYFLNSHHLST